MLIAWGLLALPACASGPPGVPVLSEGSVAPFSARQKVVAIHGGGRTAFDAVVQYDGRRLVLLGMTPMGTKAFAVEQTGASYRITRFVDMPLPAPPAAILRDIHGVYFDPPPQPLGDGWHRRRVGVGVRVDERWATGRLQERVWGSRRDTGATRVRFTDGVAPGEIPRRVDLDHPALDLRLEIHTLELHGGH